MTDGAKMVARAVVSETPGTKWWSAHLADITAILVIGALAWLGKLTGTAAAGYICGIVGVRGSIALGKILRLVLTALASSGGSGGGGMLGNSNPPGANPSVPPSDGPPSAALVGLAWLVGAGVKRYTPRVAHAMSDPGVRL